MTKSIRPLCTCLFLAICFEAVFATGYRGSFLLTHSYAVAWLAGVVALVCAALAFAWREPPLPFLGRLFPENRTGSQSWFAAWLTVGVLLRLAWVWAFPVVLKSDGFAYYVAATELAAHKYVGVYWPPGLPLVEAPFLMLLGVGQWVSVLVSLLLFAGTSIVAWLLARTIAGRHAAGVTVALLAIWPGYLTTVGINSKENLIALLLPAAMLLLWKAGVGRQTKWGMLFFAGILIGYAALTQPGCLLFVGVILCVEWVHSASLVRALKRTTIFGLAMLVAILPWTYRNFKVTHRSTLITVNGGSVFYRANNPLANASYSPEGAIHLPTDIYEADRVGYREGKRWIADHPFGFLVLAVRKQVGYLGDDGIGVYETLERDSKPPRVLYAAAKAACSGYWFALWCVLLMGAKQLFGSEDWWKWYGLCFLPVVYQWLIDSVFESGSRHHLSDVAFLAVLAALAITRLKTSDAMQTGW